MGKITSEDISEAMKRIPSPEEINLVKLIRDTYDEDIVVDDDYENVLEVWISHFLPLLRNGAFECIEKVKDIDDNLIIMPSIE